MPAERSLWRDPDFVRLWAGQTTSVFGSMLTRIALPLTALLALDSTALEQGYLQAAEALPALLAGAIGGAWIDRLRRRRVMIAADSFRALLIALVPLIAFTGGLAMWHLYAVAMLTAGATVLFESAYAAYLPGLVGREKVVGANAALNGSAAAAEMAGFSAAGSLVQIIGGPATLLVDSATFVVSAVSLGSVRRPDPVPVPPRTPTTLARDIVEGWRLVWHHATLRPLVACSTTMALAGGIFAAMYVLYAVRDLALSPAILGLVIACGGLGSLAGAVAAPRALRQLGARRVLLVGFGVGGACQCLVPLASGSPLAAAACLIAAQIFGDGFITAAAVNDASLRQQIVGDDMLGRVGGIAHALKVAALPVGALGGGIIGQVVGARAALAVAGLLFLAAPLWLVALPDRVDE
jgi:predicted MFS family arabinose efflux permease